MNNKKHLTAALGALALAAGIALFAPRASAATLDFAPARFTVVEGQEIQAVVNVVPGAGERAYTAQIDLSYPHDLFSFRGIKYGNGWVPVIRPGYDEASQGEQTLVKTAGYPNGFTGPKVFGVITFVAKRSGTGSVDFGPSSFVLDAQNDSILFGPPVSGGVSLSAVSGPQSSPAGYELANILSLGEWSNTTTFISAFIFLFLLYIIYAALRGRRSEEEE